jgi:hypothetical protein
MKASRYLAFAALAVAICLAPAVVTEASSHREAPLITEMPKVDGTDFYMFRSYEAGRDGFVTLIANYIPLQDPYGGPNYFTMDPNAEYLIHVDNDGDGVEDVTFGFQFGQALRDIQLPVGGEMVSIPLVKTGPGAFNLENTFEFYNLRVYQGEMTPGNRGQLATRSPNQGTLFGKPLDNIGRKSFPDYEGYARAFIADANIPGCGASRVFAGQRKDSFVVNLGETFDLVNYNPLGARDSQSDDLADKNVTSLILEVPISCLTQGAGDVVGGWTTATLPMIRRFVDAPGFNGAIEGTGRRSQVSRLGAPLVNEVVIGLPDKNLFNTSRPDGDAALATYVTNPTLPELLEILFPVEAPNNFPRQDLVAAFVTGIPGVNELGFGEMLRLNTSIPVTAPASQNSLGVLGGDNAGFPNGRRPGDDVVDIELRVAMGVLCHALPGVFCDPADAPSGNLPFTDGALVNSTFFDDEFPYLRTPIPGSPSEAIPD